MITVIEDPYGPEYVFGVKGDPRSFVMINELGQIIKRDRMHWARYWPVHDANSGRWGDAQKLIKQKIENPDKNKSFPRVIDLGVDTRVTQYIDFTKPFRPYRMELGAAATAKRAQEAGDRAVVNARGRGLQVDEDWLRRNTCADYTRTHKTVILPYVPSWKTSRPTPTSSTGPFGKLVQGLLQSWVSPTNANYGEAWDKLWRKMAA